MRICREFENWGALSRKFLLQKSCYPESFRFLWLCEEGCIGNQPLLPAQGLTLHHHQYWIIITIKVITFILKWWSYIFSDQIIGASPTVHTSPVLATCTDGTSSPTLLSTSGKTSASISGVWFIGDILLHVQIIQWYTRSKGRSNAMIWSKLKSKKSINYLLRSLKRHYSSSRSIDVHPPRQFLTLAASWTTSWTHRAYAGWTGTSN